jgi:hypothetical protein
VIDLVRKLFGLRDVRKAADEDATTVTSGKPGARN